MRASMARQHPARLASWQGLAGPEAEQGTGTERGRRGSCNSRGRFMSDAGLRPILSWLKSRPYHLAPWIVLLAAAPFALPRKRRETQLVDPPGLSEDRAMPPHDFEAA